MFHVGAIVKVSGDTDGTQRAGWVGKTGQIVRVFGEGAGVGETPADPFYHVKFTDNILDGLIDGFWGEELIDARP